VIADPGWPMMEIPDGSVVESSQTISASSPVCKVDTKSCAFTGMNRTTCSANGVRSKLVLDVVAKHAEYCSHT